MVGMGCGCAKCMKKFLQLQSTDQALQQKSQAVQGAMGQLSNYAHEAYGVDLGSAFGGGGCAACQAMGSASGSNYASPYASTSSSFNSSALDPIFASGAGDPNMIMGGSYSLYQ